MPTTITPEGRRRRARVAALRCHHPDRPELIADDRRTLKAAAERYLRELTATDPALTAEQRNRLALLLLGGDDA